jgi:hypothetical protein
MFLLENWNLLIMKNHKKRSDREENDSLADTLKRRILAKVDKYFPEESISNCIVSHAPQNFHSQNIMFLFEVLINHSIKKWIVAKVTLKEVTETGGLVEYETIKALFNNSEMAKNNFFVPRPLDFFHDINAMLTEKIEGVNLSHLLKKENSLFASAETLNYLKSLMKDCGKCLKIYYGLNPTENKNPLMENLFYELFEKIEINYEYLASRAMIQKKTNEMFFENIEKAKDRISGHAFKLVKYHGDFCIGNLIVNGKGITILDFNFATINNIIHSDISTYLMSLDILNPYPKNFLFNFFNIKLFKEAFLEGYFTSLSEITALDWFLIYTCKIRHTILHFRIKYNQYSHFNLMRKSQLYIYKLIYNKRLQEDLKQLSLYL